MFLFMLDFFYPRSTSLNRFMIKQSSRGYLFVFSISRKPSSVLFSVSFYKTVGWDLRKISPLFPAVCATTKNFQYYMASWTFQTCAYDCSTNILDSPTNIKEKINMLHRCISSSNRWRSTEKILWCTAGIHDPLLF